MNDRTMICYGACLVLIFISLLFKTGNQDCYIAAAIVIIAMDK